MNTIIKNHSSSKDLSPNLQVCYIIHGKDFLCTQGKMRLTTLLQQENLLIPKRVLQKSPHSFWTNWDVGKDECQELKKDGHLANPNSVLRKQAQHQHCSVVATAGWEPFLSEHHPFGSLERMLERPFDPEHLWAMVVANSALAGVFLAAAQLSMNVLPALCPSSSSGTCGTKVSTELAMQPKGFSKPNLIKTNLASYHNLQSPGKFLKVQAHSS